MAGKGAKPSHPKRDPRTGFWHYRRVVPAHLRAAIGRTDIKRSLGTSSDSFGSPTFKRAYAKARAEVERVLIQAENVQPLTQRDQYGLIRQMLLGYEQFDQSPEHQLFWQQIQQARAQISAAQLPKDQELLAFTETTELIERDLDQKVLNLVLDQLGIGLTATQRDELLTTFLAVKAPLIQKRRKELAEGNFNSVGGVLEQLPDPPKPSVSWEVLKQAWIDRRGGVAAVDGIGLSEESIHRADGHWDEIKRLTGVFAPSDVTTQMLRTWISWQRDRGLVPGSVKSNLAIIKAIWNAGLAEGLLEEDVSKTLSVSAPEVEGYLPFSGNQIRTIFKATEDADVDYMFWLPRLALYTGCRIEEMSQLTPDDLITHKGVLALHLKHDPAGKYPKSLKGKKLNERMVPLHPCILGLGFEEFVAKKSVGYIFIGRGKIKGTVGAAASHWHMRLLKKLNIWVYRKYVFHSYRGTCKDLCRSCGVPPEIHHALTGHSTGNVGDKNYGKTLRFMPDVVWEEIKKLPNPENIDL